MIYLLVPKSSCIFVFEGNQGCNITTSPASLVLGDSRILSAQKAKRRYGSLTRPSEGQKQSPRYAPIFKSADTAPNFSPAPQQISAEQLLREAVDRQEPGLQAPTQRFADLEELHEFQGRKRKEFEDYVRRNRINMNNWMRYAQWELEQKEFRRLVHS